MLAEKNILDFISHYKDSEKIFTNGQCYWFSVIMIERFHMFAPCTMYYNPVDNHFATEIGGKLYDASGCISRFGFVNWEEWCSEEPLGAERIYRDCILQIEPEEVATLPEHLRTYDKRFWF